MSCLKSVMSIDSKSNFDEIQWIIQIRKTLEEELDEDGEFSVSIFSVPNLLKSCDPNSYIPQQVSLGPYHYWRSELYDMQIHKLAAAKRFLKQLQTLKLDNLVDQLSKLEPRIRACHHKFLDFNGETLVLMMAIDASFLLEFLQDGTKMNKSSHHNAILRDVVMLENQLPLFVLRKMLELKFSSLEAADEVLISKIIGLFKEISPLKIMEEYQNIEVSKRAHVLDFLYHMIVPDMMLERQDTIEVELVEEENEGNEESNTDSRQVKKLFRELWKQLSSSNMGPVNVIKKVLLSRPMKLFVKLPWKIIINLPGVKILKQPLEYLFSSQNEDESVSSRCSDNTLMNKPPLVEEITIPSVTELLNSGVRFLPTNTISNISFDEKTCTLYLPTVCLDVNTKVFVKNLVAYEASVASGPLVITRFSELMNGIIDCEEDARILREKGVIQNHLKSDEEVADMWNGMNKSLRLSREPLLDKVIEDVNKYYNCRLKVKVVKLMKTYVFSSWKVLTLLATILLLLLMTLQAFCSVYTCKYSFSNTSQ